MKLDEAARSYVEASRSKATRDEMLLWELPGEPTGEFHQGLASFRKGAPREASPIVARTEDNSRGDEEAHP